MKRLLPILLALILLTGCTASDSPSRKSYTATYADLFDTVTTIVGYAESETAFQAAVEPLHAELIHYHRLFDIYHDYPGLHNLKTLNDRAAIEPVVVEPVILELLQACKDYYALSGGVFNPAMGSVLTLWHDARAQGILPDDQALREAAQHGDPSCMILDFQASTVFFSDPHLQLDVGAIGKGFAAQKVCEQAPEGLLISVGGNVCATGAKDSKGTPWSVGIQDPDQSQAYLHILSVTEGCVVTSGSYQRTYTVDGKSYHHIIDPKTLYPAERWTSVSVICRDSTIADMLSTSLFLLSQEEGQALLNRFDAEAVWVTPSGDRFYSPGFAGWIKQ